MKKLSDTILNLKKQASAVNFKCEICRDAEMVETENGWRVCDCKKRKITKAKMARNGFQAGKKTFDDFIVKDELSRELLRVGEKHIENPERGMAVLGQVGAGKTHVCLAVAQKLMDTGRDVVYMPYRDMITELKQHTFNYEGYTKLITELKKCETLVIDDLFKGRTIPNDLDILFQIINFRYLNDKPIIISSEKTMDELIQIDEAIGTRIKEMTQGNGFQIKKDKENNRRMTNF